MNQRLLPPLPERLPPHSIEAEQGVLGCILQAPAECLDDCIEGLAGPEVFYDLRHRTIYEVLVEMHQSAQAVDLVTLQQALKDRQQLEAVGGLAYLSGLPDKVPSAANLEYYAEIVREKSLARIRLQHNAEFEYELYQTTQEVETILDRHEQKIIASRLTGKAGAVAGAAECLHGLNDHLEERFKLHLEKRRSGLETGFRYFDRLTDGLQCGELTIIAARPSVGKTAIAGNCVEKICLRDNIPTLIITCEMSRTALLRRMLASWAGFPLAALKSGAYAEEDFAKFIAFQAALKRAPIYIIEALGGIACDRLAASVRRLWRRHGIKFLVLDYLQKVRASQRHEKRTYEIAEASGTIKGMLQETGIAGLVLAQLNRESERDKGRMPRMSDLADSGRIEQDADTIGLLHRDRSEAPEQAKLIICKQRDGNVGRLDLQFLGQFCRFQNPPMPNEEDMPNPSSNDP